MALRDGSESRAGRRPALVTRDDERAGKLVDAAPAPEVLELDPALGAALRSLSRLDREALLLVAWEDLTPAQAARSLGINPTAFRVRLLRARRRLRAKLGEVANGDRYDPNAHFEMEAS